MIINLQLMNFRNFGEKTIEFSNGLTIIVGDNGVGKTNILEAVNLLATGKSFKASVEAEMLRYGEEIARISGVVSSRQNVESKETHTTDYILHTTNCEAILTVGNNGWPKKRLLVNGVPKRLIDFAGNFKTVLFGPWDMDLVTSSPSLRRRFLDTVLSQVDREYRRSILSYEKGLRQRNRLLFRIREEGLSRSQLVFWNQLLIKNGDYILTKRQEFIEFVNSLGKVKLEYDKSVISEGRLEQYKDAEVAAATTLVGPHRDDFIFQKINDKQSLAGVAGKNANAKSLSAFGSRGEQRMGVLWLKMAELAFIEQQTHEKPTFLLDDIFSELDHEHRKIVLDSIENRQVIMTTADIHTISNVKSKNVKIIKL